MRADSKPQKNEDPVPITDFNGIYQYLNNDYPTWVALDGVLYPSASIAYQAARTDNPALRQALNQVDTYEKFKQLAISIPNLRDWAERKYRVMERLQRDKFKRNKELNAKLAETHPRGLINSFKEGGQVEQYWGMVQGKGNNALGKILMGIRDQMRNGSDWSRWISDQGTQANQKLRPALSLVVIKQDKPIDKYFLQKKSKFFFGSHKYNEYKLDHNSISKTHACIYFAPHLTLMLLDLNSSNGTSITRAGQTFKLDPLKPTPLQKDDIIVFGLSSRKYRVEIDSSKAEEELQKQRTRGDDGRRDREQRKTSRSRSRSPNHKKSKH